MTIELKRYTTENESQLFALLEREGEEWKDYWQGENRAKYRNALASCIIYLLFENETLCGYARCRGGDATACLKSTCYNLCKANYEVTVLSDCVTSWDKKKIPEMLNYYESKGCKIIGLNDLVGSINEVKEV